LHTEIPAGIPVEFLVGFRNKGQQDFVLETLEASFRYPMDFTFYIQNFSAIAYNKRVLPSHEATLAYSFIPSEAFAGRPFGLNINLAYRDSSGNGFQEAVYNETVQIVELEEGK
jgi:translocon-associated protein subunit alpha